jgi:uroporphyrinogen-III synthase
MLNKIEILSTRPLDEGLIRNAEKKGIFIDVIPFIETEPLVSVEVQQEIENALMRTAIVVFTSMNAVQVVADQMYDNLPDWKIYCIGNTTSQLVAKYFGAHTISGTAGSAAALADLIIEDGEAQSIFFFCGDQRRDELPRMLKNAGIEVEEIVVYHTIDVPRKISKDYKGILFFSPSAVQSFFSVNKLPNDVILFSIGPTTATEIKKFSVNKVIMAAEPGKEQLLERAMEYFGIEE